MRKLPIAILAAAAFSVNSYAAIATLTGSSVNVDASVDVTAPTAITASWTPVTGLQAGIHTHGTKIGSLSVANLGSADGWAVFTNAGSGGSETENGRTNYIFRNSDGSFVKTQVIVERYDGSAYGPGTGIGAGPATFFPSKHSSVDFLLNGEQQMNAGTYSATLSVSAYNN